MQTAQNQKPASQVVLMNVTGKDSVSSTTPNCDSVYLDKNAPRLSVEYAKARKAINDDYALMQPRNQALAKRLRKESKHRVVAFLEGKVSRKTLNAGDPGYKDDKQGEQFRMIVTFADGSVANL